MCGSLLLSRDKEGEWGELERDRRVEQGKEVKRREEKDQGEIVARKHRNIPMRCVLVGEEGDGEVMHL